jgi:hypothetical protein
MRLVQQLTPFTCGLACIESVSFDLGKPITQSELMVRYKDVLIGSAPNIEHFGSANGETVEFLLNDLGFVTSIRRDHDPVSIKDTLNCLTQNQAALISAHFDNSTWHFVRWAGFEDEGNVLVMNPSFRLPRAMVMPYEFTRLIAWDFTLLLVTAEDSPAVRPDERLATQPH